MFPNQNDSLQIMSHAVVGYPDLAENHRSIEGLVQSGIKLIELQIPFTDPVADGHTLVNACYEALKQGGSVRAALDLAKVVCPLYPGVSFIMMSYLNPIYRFGLDKFFTEAAEAGIKGLIVPDWPVEQAELSLPLLDQLGLAPIMLISPNTPVDRMKRIAKASRGMLYVVSRMGVTGKKAQWDDSFDQYIECIRGITDLPLAVGFGVRDIDDLRALSGHSEVAAMGSQTIKWLEEFGSNGAATRIQNLVEQLKAVA
ncbi:MAG: tryptophan synthase alpha chain [Gammaproteobacteria bacterium]|jgi:tryptophan synthase alpha chain